MSNLRAYFPLLLLPGVWLVLANTTIASADATDRARAFVKGHDRRIKPLEVLNAEAWWAANTTGKKADFAKKIAAQNRLDEALGDKKAFAELKALKEKRADVDDATVRRTIDVLYLQYLEKQVESKLLKKMVEKANAVEEKFNTFRAKVGKDEMTDNQVRNVLRKSSDSKRLQAVWEASKFVGSQVEADLKELVKLRNEAAVKLGFKNFHELQLHLNEQDGAELLALFDELDKLTRAPFEAAKADVDNRLARRYRLRADELMPWHYHDPFFQDTPKVFETDVDAPFAKADIEKMCRQFYAGIGLPVDRVLARSDLKPRKGKSQHAFCTDLNREGDVRVLANIDLNHYWASTMLHELGHAVYSSLNDNIPEKLPYALRTEAHILTTEGVAMMFERLSNRGTFLNKMGVPVASVKAYDEAAGLSLRYRLLIFSRWCQVMLRFEKAMYENPDQDLNKLWWDLVERYQKLKRPPGRNAPDYASKIHVVVAPVYYHNYMMGELFASQVHHAIVRELYKGSDPNAVIYVGNKGVGDFMKKKVFGPGKTLTWNELTRHATGEGLNAKAFAADFKKK